MGSRNIPLVRTRNGDLYRTLEDGPRLATEGGGDIQQITFPALASDAVLVP